MCKRIVRKRTKGWKLPPNTKCVTRPGPWGNPFFIDPKKAGKPEHPMACATAEEAVEKYETTLVADERLKTLVRQNLRGYDLACFCAEGQPCHANVLLMIANL